MHPSEQSFDNFSKVNLIGLDLVELISDKSNLFRSSSFVVIFLIDFLRCSARQTNMLQISMWSHCISRSVIFKMRHQMYINQFFLATMEQVYKFQVFLNPSHQVSLYYHIRFSFRNICSFSCVTGRHRRRVFSPWH